MQLDGDNAAAPEKVQPVWRGTLPVTVRLPVMTPRLGRNTLARTLLEAWQDGVELRRITILAWTPSTALALSGAAANLVAGQLGSADGLQLDDFDPDVIVGGLGAVAHDHSDDPRSAIGREELDEVADEFLAMIKFVCDLADNPADVRFLRQTRRRIEAAISLTVRATLFERTLWEEWARIKAPDYSMVAEVAEHYRDYKRQCDVIDIADILAADVRPIEHCTLALIDQAAIIPPLGLQMLRRLLPRASFVLTCS